MTDANSSASHHVIRLALLVALLTSAASSLASVAGWVNDYVNEDQALLWVAAESWGRLQPHEPTFWGQTYGTTLEAIPAKLFEGLGVSYATALPASIAAINLAMWTVLGLALYGRGRTAWVAAAFGAVALLSTEHLVIATTFNTAAGRLVACVSAAIYLRWRDQRWALLASIAASALALALEPSTLLLAAPLAVYQLSDWWTAIRDAPVARGWLRLAGALSPAAAWLGFTAWWSGNHPEQDLHPAPALTFAWSRLSDNVTHPARHLGAFVPELAPWVGVTIAGMMALVGIAIHQRSYRRAGALAALVIAYVLAIGSPKSMDYFDTPVFPAERILLAFVPALWFVGAVEPWRISWRMPRWVPAAATCVAALCVASTGWRAARWETEMGGQRERALAEWRYAIEPVTRINELCAITDDAATALDVTYAVFHNRTAAYACAATYPTVVTIFPEYERRAWVLRDFLESDDLDFVFVGPAPPCPQWITCTATWPEVTHVVRPEWLAMDDTMWDLAIRIRPPYEDYP